MSRSPFTFGLVLIAAACAPASNNSPGTPSTDSEAQQLRADFFAAGIPPVRVLPPPATRAMQDLGQALFFDKILSGSEDVSCATCHLPQFGTSDGRTLPQGVHASGFGPSRGGGVTLARNSSPLFALHLRDSLFWDGQVHDVTAAGGLPPAVFLSQEMIDAFDPRLRLVAAQAMLPPVSRSEMRGEAGESDLADLEDGYDSFGGTTIGTREVWEQLMNRLLSIPAYVDLFREAYPTVQIEDLNFAHAGNAIANFEAKAFYRIDSRFNRFMSGNDFALTTAEMLGAREFLRAGCAACHSGPLLSDRLFHNTGLPQLGPGHGGIEITPATGGRPDFGREGVTGLDEDRYKFRTASLLNVQLTGPYGHAGQFKRLRDFVAHYRDVELSNLNYDIAANVDELDLLNTLVPNSQDVLDTLDPLLKTPNDFDADAIALFLRSLTAIDALHMSDVVPASVPSGLPVF